MADSLLAKKSFGRRRSDLRRSCLALGEFRWYASTSRVYHNSSVLLRSYEKHPENFKEKKLGGIRFSFLRRLKKAVLQYVILTPSFVLNAPVYSREMWGRGNGMEEEVGK